MADYRVRGYMRYSRLLAGNAACAKSWIAACGAQGPWLIRASTDAIKIEGPSTGYAGLNGTMFDCPEAILELSADSSGANPQADGAFPQDSVRPALVPATLVLLVPGGNPNSLQLRTLTTQCIHEFTVGASWVLWVLVWWLSAGAGCVPRARPHVPTPHCTHTTHHAHTPTPQLTQATSYIMDVAPQEYISWLSAAGRLAPSPAALLAGALAAAALALL